VWGARGTSPIYHGADMAARSDMSAYIADIRINGGGGRGGCNQGATKICRLYWLTNSALVYQPKCG
jgi:hypothetical protein